MTGPKNNGVAATAAPCVRFPVPVLIDQREQLPYTFDGLCADRSEGGYQLLIDTRKELLRTGDYTLDGYAARVAVERKSLCDLFNTLGQGRKRFEAELHRLSEMQFAAVVVEAEWSAILYAPPEYSQLNVKTVSRSVIAWQQRYPRVHWLMLPDRRHGEAFAFRVLYRFWQEDQGK